MRKLVIVALSLAIMVGVVYQSKKGQEPPRRPPVAENPIKKRPAPPEVKPETTFEEAVAGITEADLRRHMDYLCSQELEGRMSGKQGNKMAAAYVEKEFASYGLKTVRQKFPVSQANPGPKGEQGDTHSENVIGWIEGDSKEEVMVVGAHMDHIGYGPQWSSARGGGLKIHPGADDNASGTAGLLEIARAHGKCKSKVKRTTIFIAFSGEEMGLIGSKYYCNNPMFPVSNPAMSKHIFMLNMDMIGRLGQARLAADFGDTEQVAPDLQGAMKELGAKYTFARSITGSGSGGSDHASFAAKRVPVCILHTGQHAQYHTPEDTVARINFAGMTQVARYATELSWRIGQGPRPREYGGGPLKKSMFDER